MKRVHVLSAGFTSPNSAAFLYPLMVFRTALRDIGLNVRVFYKENSALTDCDVLLVEGKALSKQRSVPAVLETAHRLSQRVPVIWCDQTDSTGTFFGQILPHVRRYAKAQILKDKTGYQQDYYADRIYTDYYHKHYGVTDDISYNYQSIQNVSDLSKVYVSWNSGLMNHGVFGPYLNRIQEYAHGLLPVRFSKAFTPPSSARSLKIAARMGTNYTRRTVSYQRQRIQALLQARLQTNKVSRFKYFKELKNAQLVVSPFGLGEITLKDFEVFLTGGMLFKPDMSHLRTWPDFYEKDVTYGAHDWNLKNFDEKLAFYLDHTDHRLSVAQAAQERYRQFTTAAEAPFLFARHFHDLVSMD